MPGRGSYWDRSQRPLQVLAFLLPLVVIYELGLVVYGAQPNPGVVRDIYARSLLFDFFDLFGITGYYLPGLIIVVVLLSWHLVRRDPWRLNRRFLAWMWLESVVLAVPLLVFALILFRQPVTQMVLGAGGGPGGGPQDADWRTRLVFSIGAGVYEELLFRLIAIALLHMVFVDLLALPETLGQIGAIVLSTLAFTAYHFSGDNPFALGKGLFYTGAGLYLAMVYVARGFGIVVGTHAVYDLIVVAIEWG